MSTRPIHTTHIWLAKVVVSSVVALALSFVLLLLLDARSAQATPPIRPPSAGNVSTCDEASLLTALAGGGLVTFSCSGIITLTTTPSTGIVITAPTTIDASGQSVTLSGGNTRRVFNVTAGITLNIINLTLANGSGIPYNPTNNPVPGGGVLFNNGGTVNITNSIFISNSDGGGRQGGAIVNYSGGTLNVSSSAFISNTSIGIPGEGGSSGAIINYGTLSIINSVFSNNAANTGGVTANVNGMMTVSGSTFSNNNAVFLNNPGGGGGVFYNGATLIITNSTFSGNTAAGNGGGCHQQWQWHAHRDWQYLHGQQRQ